MFIFPSSQVLLLGAAVVLVLGSEQWLISGAWLRMLRFQKAEGGIADRQVAGCPPTTNLDDFAQRVSAHRTKRENPARASVFWALATLGVLGLLTAMLMVGIAISV